MTLQDRAKRISYIGIFTTLSLIMFLIESMFNFLLPLPYVKLGFSNIIIIVALVFLGFKSSFVVVILKCLISGLFTGNVLALAYSLTGGILSLLVMFILLKLTVGRIGLVSVSVVGAITHNIAQLLIASLIMQTFAVFVILPYLIIVSIIAGILVGASAHYLVKKIDITV